MNNFLIGLALLVIAGISALFAVPHVVDWDQSPANTPCDDPGQLRRLISTSCQNWPTYAGKPKWVGHGVEFIRTMLHLWHRLENRGHVVSLVAAFNAEMYGLSTIEDYRDALGDEPGRCDWRPLREVLDEPAPDEFKRPHRR